MDSKRVTGYQDEVKGTGIANISPDPVLRSLFPFFFPFRSFLTPFLFFAVGLWDSDVIYN
jgi:hypothetical protein